MRTQPLLVWREPKVDTILQRRLRRSGYRVCPKVRLSDAICRDDNEHLPDREFEYLRGAHLDFLITKDLRPVFAVEFDGAQHAHDPKTVERDVLKNRLCKAASLPLLRITGTEINDRDDITLLDYMLMRYVAWQEEIDGIRGELAEYAANLPEDADPEDLAVDLDPSFHFNLRHPYPGLAAVKERLWRHHGVACVFDNLRQRPSPRYHCSAHALPGGAADREQFTSATASALVWPPGRSKDSPVFSHITTVTVRSWLPLNSAALPEVPFCEGSDVRELAAAFRSVGARINQMWFPELPGINPWDIAENYAEFLGFRAIERWARGLRRR